MLTKVSKGIFLILGSYLGHDRLPSHGNDRCSSSYLEGGISFPGNAKLRNLAASKVEDYALSGSTINYCNVTVTYTHPGWNDTVNIYLALPFNDWNGRFLGIGGGGWMTGGGPTELLDAAVDGYSAGNTDGGHPPIMGSSSSWYKTVTGELNIPLLKDFASVALNDLAVVGKQVSHQFYGYGPKHAYWRGCSTGGRQGLMMAQRFPTAYDGISAISPAIQWPRFLIAEYWGQFIMNQLDHYPPTCVFDTITAAAVKACDNLDGVVDGVISNLKECRFDPDIMIDQKANCSGTLVTITPKDAEIVRKTWQGPRKPDGTFLWWGINPGTPFKGLTNTSCTSLHNCTGSPFSIGHDWMLNWVIKKPSFDLTKLTLDEFVDIFYRSNEEYSSIIGTDNPDLSSFKENGGKMITWHGLTDELIYPGGMEDYYRGVEAHDPNVRDFYRFFPAPGVEHCGSGAGEVPIDPLGAVIDWVEKGLEPDTLPAVSEDGTKARNLCQYPLVSVYKGGDPTKAGSFTCQPRF